MLEGLYDWFVTYGTVYALLGLFIILVIDATVFPTLPELFAVLAFLLNPVLLWGAAILVLAVTAEMVGNTLLYVLVKKKRLPRKVRGVMKRWVRFLVLKDERILLVNRIAPVIPFTGAFIATCDWSYRRSMAYLIIGGLVKYAVLLCLVALLALSASNIQQARWISLVAIIVIICISFVFSQLYKSRLKRKWRLQMRRAAHDAGVQKGAARVETGEPPGG